MAPTVGIDAAPIGLLKIDASALAPQRPTSVEPLGVERSRGPPALA